MSALAIGIRDSAKQVVAASTNSYLTPTVGWASTPDIAIPAGDSTWVFRLSGPVIASALFLCGQWGAVGNRTYGVTRSGISPYTIQALVSADGSSAGGKSANTTVPAGITVPEWWAITYKPDSTGVISHKSTDGIVWTTHATGTAVAGRAYFNSTFAIYIGCRDGTTSAQWDGRIYFAEHRTGASPTGGTLLWRFDPNEHVSGTSWIDPRGLTWTLTSASAITHP